MVSFLFWVLLLVVLGSAVLALGYAFITSVSYTHLTLPTT